MVQSTKQICMAGLATFKEGRGKLELETGNPRAPHSLCVTMEFTCDSEPPVQIVKIAALLTV